MLPVHHKIAELNFKNTEQLGQAADDHKTIYDIYCESTTGKRFIVELQRIKQEYFKDCTIYYATFPIVEQSKKGRDWAYELKPIYCINILDFTLAETINTEVPLCQNSCHPHPNNLNGVKGDNHGTIQRRTQTSHTRQTFITHTH